MLIKIIKFSNMGYNEITLFDLNKHTLCLVAYHNHSTSNGKFLKDTINFKIKRKKVSLNVCFHCKRNNSVICRRTKL